MQEHELEAQRVYAELFRHLELLAPGSPQTTLTVLDRMREWLPDEARIADFGCGAGAASVTLAAAMPRAHVIAIDTGASFVEQLLQRARRAGCADRIEARVGDMGLPGSAGIQPASLDLIWCAAAVYSIGWETALRVWPPFVRRNGCMAVSDLVWVNPPDRRPSASVALWQREYPPMRAASDIEALVAAAGWVVVDRFRQARSDWAAYYEPLRLRVATMRSTNEDVVARAILDGMQEEIDVFDSGDASFAYEFFLLRSADA